MKTVAIIFQIILSLGLISFVLAQPSKTDGLKGLMVGVSSDTFYSKNKSLTKEKTLMRITAILFVLFCANTVWLSLIG